MDELSRAQETPIKDLLAKIPADARLMYNGDGFGMNIPIGSLASKALAEIERLEAALAMNANAAPQAEPVLQDIEQYRLQMAGISVAAIGYWKEGDEIHPDYDTPALRDVAKLYVKYDELYKTRNAAPQDATDWEGIAADQAMTIAMMKVDYQQLQALVTSQGVRMMEQEEWQKDAAKYRWLLRLFVYLGDSPAETLDAAIVKTMAKMPLEDV